MQDPTSKNELFLCLDHIAKKYSSTAKNKLSGVYLNFPDYPHGYWTLVGFLAISPYHEDKNLKNEIFARIENALPKAYGSKEMAAQLAKELRDYGRQLLSDGSTYLEEPFNNRLQELETELLSDTKTQIK